MAEITIYSKSQCPYCTNAKQLLKQKKYQFTEIDLSDRPDLAVEVAKRSGQRTVPQIFVGSVPVGGYTDLVKKTSNGEFDALVNLIK